MQRQKLQGGCRSYGEAARPLITGVTLWGGFASTVCWPISAFLSDRLGWRGACLIYAAIHIAVVLPLYAFGVPQAAQLRPAPGKAAAPAPVDRRAFVLLAAGFTLASMIMTVLAVVNVALVVALIPSVRRLRAERSGLAT